MWCRTALYVGTNVWEKTAASITESCKGNWRYRHMEEWKETGATDNKMGDGRPKRCYLLYVTYYSSGHICTAARLACDAGFSSPFSFSVFLFHVPFPIIPMVVANSWYPYTKLNGITTRGQEETKIIYLNTGCAHRDIWINNILLWFLSTNM